MNILVLGGHGFIGSHIVDQLVDAGHKVRVFARRPAAFPMAVRDCVYGDFLDSAKIIEALIGMDMVIHCISTTVPATSAKDPVYDIETNLVGSVELLRQMQSQGIQRLIYLSTGGVVYGNPEVTPVSETARLMPISSYGAVKVAIEKFIGVAEAEWGLKPVILRPSNPFGERQGHAGVQGLVSTLLVNAINGETTVIYGDGSAVRDYLYVGDVASLVRKVVVSDRCGVFNVGYGQGFTINQLIEMVKSVTGLDIRLEYRQARNFDVSKIVLDSSLAQECFKWKVSVSLQDGIKRTYEWLKNN